MRNKHRRVHRYDWKREGSVLVSGECVCNMYACFSVVRMLFVCTQVYLLRQHAQQLSSAQRDASWVFKYLLVFQVRI